MRSIVLFFLFLGILFMVIGQHKNSHPVNTVEYRYIPRSFTDEQYQQLPIMATFGNLFTHPDPWLTSIGYDSYNYPKKQVF